MPVGQLLRSISSAELTEWRAWEQIHGPLGSERADYLAASISRINAEIHRNTKERRQPFRVEEFLPFSIPGSESTDSPGTVTAENGMDGFIAWAKGLVAGGHAKEVATKTQN